jgi:hypothetical protein
MIEPAAACDGAKVGNAHLKTARTHASTFTNNSEA